MPGDVTGIIPQFLQSRERPFEDLTELVVTDDMHARKWLMFERADAFVALCRRDRNAWKSRSSRMTWSQLGRHQKPVLLANIAGFWRSADPAPRRDAAREIHPR